MLVRVDWFPLLHKPYTIAKTHRALLLDETTNETAMFHMKTQCVDCVGESMFFELLGERESGAPVPSPRLAHTLAPSTFQWNLEHSTTER